jgi:transposase InsO family protein
MLGDHVWSYDFVMARTHDGRAFRMLTIIDEYTRECLAIEVSRRFAADAVLLYRLTELFVSRRPPYYIRLDNVPEYTARAVREWLSRVGVKTLYIEPGRPWPLAKERHSRAVGPVPSGTPSGEDQDRLLQG